MTTTQFVTFPLHPIVQTETGLVCPCYRTGCTDIGKHPAVLWRHIEAGEPTEAPKPGAGYGIKTGAAPKGSGIIVVDLDGDDAIDAWLELGEHEDTYAVSTGREGGLHLYFQHPGFRVRNSKGSLAPKIDIRGDGGFVVGPGSPHRSGANYALASDEGVEPAPCPEWLVTWLRAESEKAPEPTERHSCDVSDSDELAFRRELYSTYLRNEAAPCVEGHGGDHQLFEVVQYGAYDLALPIDDVVELIDEHFDPRCEPPWGEELYERVLHKARDAKTHSTRPRIEPPPNPKKHPQLAALFSKSVTPRAAAPMPTSAPGPDTTPVPNTTAGLNVTWGSWSKTPEPPRYLVEGLIPAETVGMLVAMGSSLKTWVALDIGRCVATGEPWLGRFPVRRGKVLILDYESGQHELRRRMHLLAGGADIPDLGSQSYPPLRTDDEKLWTEIGSYEGLSLVIVDSFLESALGVDENETAAATPLQYAARFSNESGAGVIFVHHTTKSDGGGDARKTVRGSSAIYGACDWAFTFSNISEDENHRRMLMTNIKPCMGPKPPAIPIELTDENGLTYAADEAQVLAMPRKTDADIRAAVLAVLGRDGSIATKEELRKRVGVGTTRLETSLSALLVTGEVAKLRHVGYTLDSNELRDQRVLTAASKGVTHRTPAKLAEDAQVETAHVNDVIRRRLVVESGSGRYMPRPGLAA